jgi:DNA-binding transcriptional ArsR family regulator
MQRILGADRSRPDPRRPVADRLISKPAVSQHLSVLEAAGLVKSEKKGQFVHYSLVRDSLVNTLNDYVQEVCPVSKPLKAESARLAKKAE